MFGSPAFILLFRISYVKIADKVLFMEGVGRDMDSMDKSFDIFFFDLDGTLTDSSNNVQKRSDITENITVKREFLRTMSTTGWKRC